MKDKYTLVLVVAAIAATGFLALVACFAIKALVALNAVL